MLNQELISSISIYECIIMLACIISFVIVKVRFECSSMPAMEALGFITVLWSDISISWCLTDCDGKFGLSVCRVLSKPNFY